MVDNHYMGMQPHSKVVIELNPRRSDFGSKVDSYSGEETKSHARVEDNVVTICIDVDNSLENMRQGDRAIHALLANKKLCEDMRSCITTRAKDTQSVVWYTYVAIEMLTMLDYPGKYNALCSIGANNLYSAVGNMKIYHPSMDVTKLTDYVYVVNSIYKQLKHPTIYKYITQQKISTLPEISVKLAELARRYDASDLRELSTQLRSMHKQ